MKNLNFKYILTSILLIPLVSTLAFGQKAFTDKRENIDLSEYKTYEWIFTKENIPEDQLIFDGSTMLIYNNTSANKNVKDAIDTQLAAKGFSHDKSSPDMLVNFHILEKPTELRTFTLTNGQNYLGFGPKTTNSKMVPVKAGTVMVNFIDANTGTQLWQGFASGAFDATDMKDFSNLEAKVIAIFNEWDFDPFAE
ncbi:DUF4136 domain-containing protein [Aquiflexum gelatinilyticum]|uniref:DUF4136 domain-containing protein n=1 Tax=Aquiflexum gelatinilyticum TaxID=2961943 RepID=A0A9X2P358_9BACT|nr:DUF4136 domain-containing protein [Aquiflexum gelatinilyticum]MCR9014906.1 DUF4136 domain-containing protein [Aquiflexum gelatinilyticum]